jgi:acetylornithine/N-succinyldiaminopimelate aminotransferase
VQALDAKHSIFAEIRGRGLMLGAQLRSQWAGRAGEILDHAAREGLLLLQAGPDVLRFTPALNIGSRDLREGLDRLDRALENFLQAA